MGAEECEEEGAGAGAGAEGGPSAVGVEATFAVGSSEGSDGWGVVAVK